MMMEKACSRFRWAAHQTDLRARLPDPGLLASRCHRSGTGAANAREVHARFRNGGPEWQTSIPGFHGLRGSGAARRSGPFQAVYPRLQAGRAQAAAVIGVGQAVGRQRRQCRTPAWRVERLHHAACKVGAAAAASAHRYPFENVRKIRLSSLKRLVAIYPISGRNMRKNPPGTGGLSL